MISVSAEGLCKDYAVGTHRDQRIMSILTDINTVINPGEFVSIGVEEQGRAAKRLFELMEV